MKSKILTFLLSLVIAFALWIYVVTVVSPESEQTYEVEVKFGNEMILNERNLMVTKVHNKTVRIKLSGNRSDLKSLDSGEITVRADLSGVESAETQKLVYTVTFPGRYANNAFVTESKEPGEVTVDIAVRDTKSIPVNVEYVGDVKTGYAWDEADTILDKEYVTITGPDYVLAQISQAVIRVDMTGRNASFVGEYNYTLCDRKGDPVDAALVETNLKSVEALVKVMKREKIEFVVEPIYDAAATKTNTVITIEPAEIDVAGSEAELQKLRDKLRWELDLSKIEDGYEQTIDLTDLLENVKNLSGNTKVTITVTYKDMETAELTITDFRIKGSDGLNVEFVTKELVVVVRGPKDMIKNIRAKNITVTVDLTDATPGEGIIVKPSIVIDGRFVGVALFEPGTYSIWLDILDEETQPIEDTP